MKDELELRARELLAAEISGPNPDGYIDGGGVIASQAAIRALVKLMESTPSNILMREALEVIREYCLPMPSAAAKAIVATCDSALSISVGGGVVVGEQDQQVTGDGLRPQPATHEPSPSGLGPSGGCQAQEDGWLAELRRIDVQALHAAFSRRDWHAAESAGNALRDKIDRFLIAEKRNG